MTEPLRFTIEIRPEGLCVVSHNGEWRILADAEGKPFTPRSARLFAGWLTHTEAGRRFLPDQVAKAGLPMLNEEA